MTVSMPMGAVPPLTCSILLLSVRLADAFLPFGAAIGFNFEAGYSPSSTIIASMYLLASS